MDFTAKDDFLHLFDRIIAPLTPHIQNGSLKIGYTGAVYDEVTVCAEGFLRILWGLVPCIAGGEKKYEELAKVYREGFSAGTDKNSDTYWGDCSDINQMFVEMAAISYALLFAKDTFWTPLDENSKDALSEWLYGINEYFVPTNNWQLFKVLVNCALKKAGRKYSRDNINAAFKTTEETYRGNGWYTDGHTQRRDYYVSFAIHFYCLIYSAVMGDEDAERCMIFKKRACEFAQEFIYWFDDNGDAVPYGRSLIYRFAQTAFWSACLIADVKPFDYGVIKGIISRHFKRWFEYPIFDGSGILTLGYKYPNLFMTEQYNAPGSPYWSLKALAFLMLDSEHPFWKAEVQPLPPLDTIKNLKHADMIITRTPENVCLYPTGLCEAADMGKTECKYSKFVYSTKYGFSVSRGNGNIYEKAPDSMLAFCADGFVYVRNIITYREITDNTIHTKWSPVKGIDVETKITPCSANKHIREHIITSLYDCEAYDCGFAVEFCYETHTKRTVHNQTAAAQSGNMKCTVSGSDGEGYIINAYPNTNLIFNRTVIPSVKYNIKKGISRIKTIVEYE